MAMYGRGTLYGVASTFVQDLRVCKHFGTIFQSQCVATTNTNLRTSALQCMLDLFLTQLNSIFQAPNIP